MGNGINAMMFIKYYTNICMNTTTQGILRHLSVATVVTSFGSPSV